MKACDALVMQLLSFVCGGKTDDSATRNLHPPHAVRRKPTMSPSYSRERICCREVGCTSARRSRNSNWLSSRGTLPAHLRPPAATCLWVTFLPKNNENYSDLYLINCNFSNSNVKLIRATHRSVDFMGVDTGELNLREICSKRSKTHKKCTNPSWYPLPPLKSFLCIPLVYRTQDFALIPNIEVLSSDFGLKLFHDWHNDFEWYFSELENVHVYS